MPRQTIPTLQNALLYSEQFENAVWGNADNDHVVSANSVIAPDGTLTADRWTYPASTGIFGYGAQSCLGLDASQNWTFSVWLKMASGSRAGNIQISNWSLTTQTSPSYTITTTWQKLSFTIQAGSMRRTDRVAVGFINFLSGNVIDVWGAQLTQANFASDYIVTAGAAVNTGAIRNRPATVQNLVLYSEQFDNAAWIKEGTVSITANQVANPVNGTVDADLFVNVSNTQGIYQRSITVPLGATYTRSVWLRCASGTMNVRAAGYFGTEFSATWAVTTTWQRFTASGIKTTGTTEVGFYLFNSDVGTLTNLYAWGAQITIANWEGAYATTTAAAVNTGNLRNRPATLQNLLKYSNDFSNAAWGKVNCTVVNNNATAPDGTLTADTITTTTTAFTLMTQAFAILSPAETFSWTIWLQAGTVATATIGIFDASSWGDNDSDYEILSGPGTLTRAAGSLWNVAGLSTTVWTQIRLTRYRLTAGSTQGLVYVYPRVNASSNAGDTLKLWRPQVAKANWSGAYVATTASAVNTGNIRNTAMNLQQNLSTNSASINTNAFSLINASITVAGGTPPIGVTNCDFLKEDSAASVHALNLNSQSNVTGNNYNFSLMAKSTNRRLQIYSNKGSGGNFLVNLMTGALISSNAGADNTRNIQIKAIDGGFYRISFSYTSLYTGTNYHQVLLDNGSTNSYTGDNVSGASITGLQTTQASSMITYVETGATAINTGIPRALII